MVMSHAGHNHPATPAGRAACRKAGGGTQPNAERAMAVTSGGTKARQPARKTTDTHTVVTEPVGRKRRATATTAGKMRRLASDADLTDVPARMVPYVRTAWDIGGMSVEFTPNPDGNEAGNEYLIRIVKAGSTRRGESFVALRGKVTGPKTMELRAWHKPQASSVWITIRDVKAHIELVAGHRTNTFETKEP